MADTDRELLELAAKAAGIPLKPDFAERYDYYMADRLMWSPLTDDGDALRLAVKLGISIAQEVRNGTVFCDAVEDHPGIAVDEEVGIDPIAATRRAIVRAAAEIGRAMP